MADRPFDRTNIGIRERPLSGDFNQQFSQEATTLRELCRMIYSQRLSTTSQTMLSKPGLIGDSLRVAAAAPANMTVIVSPGHGFVFDPIDLPTDIGSPDMEGIDDLSSFKPVFLAAPAIFSVPAAPAAGQGRTDIVEIRADRRLENSITRRQLDVGSTSFVDKIFSKTLAYGLDGRTGIVLAGGGNSTAGLSYKIGTPAATSNNGDRRFPDDRSITAPPATSPGYIKLADVQVLSGMASIADTDINDRRPLIAIGGVLTFGARWRLQWNGGAPIVTLLDMNVPPGVVVSLDPSSSNRGEGTIGVAGGEISSCSIRIEVTFNNSSSQFAFGCPDLAIGQTVSSVIGNIAGLFDGGFPPLSIAGRSKMAIATFSSRAVLNGGTVNNSNAVLEDGVVTASGTLTY